MKCKYVQTTSDGTSWCALAEQSAQDFDEIKRQRDELVEALEEVTSWGSVSAAWLYKARALLARIRKFGRLAAAPDPE